MYTVNDKRNLLATDRFNYDVLNHTDLTRPKGYSGEINLETVNWANYDLVVIDESHNFRNTPSKAEGKSRYEHLMNDIIRSGVKTKVLMLSATPVNNRMNDLKIRSPSLLKVGTMPLPNRVLKILNPLCGLPRSNLTNGSVSRSKSVPPQPCSTL
jgi:SNF2 family DNA or RNA helicase